MLGFIPDLSLETWTLLVLFTTLVLLYGYAPYGFFKKINVPGPKPWPFIGTFLEYRKGVHNVDVECLRKYGKVWGLYDGRQPLLCVADTSIIKTILVKECYAIFTNRRDFGLNGPLRDAVSIVEDEKWKRIRSILSPSFTSGRLKEMYKIMLKHSANLICSLQKKVDADEVVEVKEVFGPYSMDVVTSSAFSVEIDSINHPSDPFVANIKRMVKFNFLNPLLVVIILFPFLLPLLEKMNLSFFPPEVMEFFFKFLRTIKSDRSNKDSKRVDFMQLMVNAEVSDTNSEDGMPSKGGERQDKRLRLLLGASLKPRGCAAGLTDNEILAQAMIFIFAGYETSSSTLCFTAHLLATHPNIQKVLQQEVDETFPNKGQPSYEALMQMEYLDMVINESMRLYPIANRLERVSKSSVEIEGVTIPKGTVITVPVYALHRDPDLWPNPEEFKPERFSKENKDNIDPYAYLPFGAGPRNCIGMRFAQLMMKLALVEILQKFSFVTCKETELPLTLSVDAFTTPTIPIKLKLEPREAPGVSASS